MKNPNKKGKNPFDALYQAVRNEKSGVGVAYTRGGNYSVFIRLENPVEQYCADIDAYYKAADIYTGVIKTLGEGYAFQKQDIYCRNQFRYEHQEGGKFLHEAYMRYFEGREYMRQESYIIITQELKRGSLMLYDKRKWTEFWTKVEKVTEMFEQEKIKYHLLEEDEIREYLHRYLCVEFKPGSYAVDNFLCKDGYIKSGEKLIRMIDLVDIDEVLLPEKIRPFSQAKGLPEDLTAFLGTVPETDQVVYTQTIIIPPQRKEQNKLTSNMNRKRNIPDPANLLAAKDIEDVINAIAKENRLLVYTNFQVMLMARDSIEKLERAYNYCEKQFYDRGIVISKNSYNQLELFINSFPGNAYSLQSYERFLCLHDAAVCLLSKERVKTDEDTPLKIYYTNRHGVPIAIDISGKEGKEKLTTNSNFFSLGPSGSGKSFHMNSVVRQLHEQDTDIVLVDTGNSYEGLCAYFSGRYISYTPESPITMNPFLITREENNLEKQNFLKSLILLIWKGADGTVTREEEEIISNTLTEYYNFYFEPEKAQLSREEQDQLIEELMLEEGDDWEDEIDTMDAMEAEAAEEIERQNIVRRYDALNEKLANMAEHGEDGERENAQRALTRIRSQYETTLEELKGGKSTALVKVEKMVAKYNRKLRALRVTELSFNSWFRFSSRYIPMLCHIKGLEFNINNYRFLMSKFYKGGAYETTLNNSMDGSLFNEPFIVFEIDAIKDDPILFPIVTLIIMDVFLQKMRLKRNRKALIIEEAWKAIASPMMAGYIKYLYKTVRKFWGIVGVVTQELDDIISNATVREAIINNSEITILLDQSKFRERYDVIAQMLGLGEVEQRKIWTINQLDNHEGRSFFKEVYIRRGQYGQVYGVEESPESYMAYTTERIEKDALKVYISRYGDYQQAVEQFVRDWQMECGQGSKADAYAMLVNDSLRIYKQHCEGDEKAAESMMLDAWKDFKMAAGNFFGVVSAKGDIL